MIDISVMLDNVRSALNVGSILRTCECVGVKHAYLCGITPTPDNPKVCKTALNVEKLISWSYHLNTLDTVKNLKQHGSLIWSLEITQHATPITEVIKHQIDSPIVLVAGNEQAGVDPEILVISDKTIFLPMVGKKHSLNISVALGTAITMLISSSWE